MFHIDRILNLRTRNPACIIVEPAYHLPYITAPFLFGLLLGTLTGALTEFPQELFFPIAAESCTSEKITFLLSFWRSFRFPLFSALLATSILGTFLIPLLSAFRAYVFACTTAFILCENQSSACLRVFVCLGIPALMNLPAFLLISADGFVMSRYLLTRNDNYRIRDLPILPHFIIVLLLCVVEALYLAYLMPLLLQHI